ncbi:Hypothetical protein B591_14283 [Streptomyces sp. GBA 94-10 4N24]|nr:Hypothetical protein B591_14283 [Streptomyces sp. GBA 94-10 4N24]UZN59837.1 Hypothetical protein B591N_14283 [Streptomyces sp. GBA 94-10 4N24]
MSAGRSERRDGDGRNPQGPGRTEGPDGGHERNEQQPKQTGNAAVNEQGGKRSERPGGESGEDTREPGTEPAGGSPDEAREGVRDETPDEAARDAQTEPADGDADRADAPAADTAAAAETTVIPSQPAAEPTASFDEDDLRRLLRGETPPPEAPTGPAGPPDPGLDGPAPLGEDDLRRILHGAAEGLGPADADATLEHLRRAVPARRARKRQAVVGMAAAALFVGTAVPALVHVTTSPSSDDRPSIAGHGEDVQGGTGGEGAGSGKEPGAGADKGDADAPGADKERDKAKGGQSAEPGQNPDGSPLPEDARAASSPLCDATQLGSASTTTEGRGADGSLYGTFRVTNVSDRGCTVASSGTVSAVALGAADASKVSVVPHTPGDPATGLPSPITAASQLVLAPGAAYEVKFAWIPSGSCPNTGSGGDGGTGGTTPTDPTPPAEGSSGGTDQGATAPDIQPQLMRSDGGRADGSVTVSHAADPGAPTTATTVPDACAGTVYHTDALPAGG